MADKTGGKNISPLQDLVNADVTKLDNGDYVIGSAVMKRIRNERLRRATITGVPNTPRFLTRDGGGVGVAKGGSRLHQVTIESLRSIRERGPIFQAIHAARQYQVRRMATPWDGVKGHVGWRVVHKDNTERDAKTPDGFQPYIDRFRAILERPAPTYDCATTGALLMGLEEDLLTINRPSLEILHSALDPERVVGFRPIDGGIIWPTLVWLEKWKADHPKWNSGYDVRNLTTADQLDLASAAIGQDLFAAKHCLVRDGILEAVYPPHKLIVSPLQNRTDINVMGYPPSAVEQSLEMGVGFINSWDYNSNYFTRGMMAEFMIGISGDVHDDDVDAFVDMFRESTQGVQRAWQPPIMPLPGEGDIKKIDLKASNKEMMYEVWLQLTMSLCTAVYRMDPTTVNSKPWDGGSTTALSAPNRNLEIALAKEEGLQGDLNHLAQSILCPLSRRCHPDLRVVFEFGDFDPEKEGRVYEIRAKIDMTRNEIRIMDGKAPRGYWVEDEEYEKLSDELKLKYDDNLWNQPTDPAFINAYQQAKMGMGEDQGDGASEDQQEPEDDGFGEPVQANDNAPVEGMNKGRKLTRNHTTVYVYETD